MGISAGAGTTQLGSSVQEPHSSVHQGHQHPSLSHDVTMGRLKAEEDRTLDSIACIYITRSVF